MRKYLISPKGIIGEIVLLLLLLCLWLYHNKPLDTGHGAGENEWKNDTVAANADSGAESDKDFIKWVEFNVSLEALNQAYALDVGTYQKEVHLDWVELLAYLGAKYGGDFSKYKESDMTDIAKRLQDGEATMEVLTADMKHYKYYKEAYGAVLDGMVGEYKIEEDSEEKITAGRSAQENTAGGGLLEENTMKKPSEGDPPKKVWKKYYGLKAHSPIAKGFPYFEFDDFGVSRSYGYKRNHLGHDMMGQVGTPRRIKNRA